MTLDEKPAEAVPAPIQPKLSDVYKMSSLSPKLRSRMRALSLGPIAWGFWTWTFHQGDCWAVMVFDGDEELPEKMIGWAAITREMDHLPVIGCYILEQHRKLGVGRAAVVKLLKNLVDTHVLAKGDPIFNSSHRWPKYKEIIESCGLRALHWE